MMIDFHSPGVFFIERLSKQHPRGRRGRAGRGGHSRRSRPRGRRPRSLRLGACRSRRSRPRRVEERPGADRLGNHKQRGKNSAMAIDTTWVSIGTRSYRSEESRRGRDYNRVIVAASKGTSASIHPACRGKTPSALAAPHLVFGRNTTGHRFGVAQADRRMTTSAGTVDERRGRWVPSDGCSWLR